MFYWLGFGVIVKNLFIGLISQKNILLYFGFIAVSFMIVEFTGKSPIKFIITLTLAIFVYIGAFDLLIIFNDEEE